MSTSLDPTTSGQNVLRGLAVSDVQPPGGGVLTPPAGTSQMGSNRSFQHRAVGTAQLSISEAPTVLFPLNQYTWLLSLSGI